MLENRSNRHEQKKKNSDARLPLGKKFMISKVSSIPRFILCHAASKSLVLLICTVSCTGVFRADLTNFLPMKFCDFSTT